jgi:hypothetical protein
MRVVNKEVYWEVGDEVIFKNIRQVEEKYRNLKCTVIETSHPIWHEFEDDQGRCKRVESNYLYMFVRVSIPSLNEEAFVWKNHLDPGSEELIKRLIIETL